MEVPVEKCMTDYKHYFMPDILKGKVAFITGGGTGIGLVIAEVLMRHGCSTVIASRRLEVVQHAARELHKATGQKCLPIQMDVRKPQEIINAMDQTMSEMGKIDILVNNAAGNFLCPASGLSFNAFKTVMEIDAMGTFNVSKAAYDKCLSKHGGVIVNMSATLHYRGRVMQTHAGAAKAAIDALTRHLAVEWGPQGIRVVGIAPGPIADTEGMRRLGPKGPDHMAIHDAMTKIIPLQREGKREEIAHTVLFLVSPPGGLITGETIVADGAAWLSTPNSMEFIKGMMSNM